MLLTGSLSVRGNGNTFRQARNGRSVGFCMHVTPLASYLATCIRAAEGTNTPVGLCWPNGLHEMRVLYEGWFRKCLDVQMG